MKLLFVHNPTRPLADRWFRVCFFPLSNIPPFFPSLSNKGRGLPLPLSLPWDQKWRCRGWAAGLFSAFSRFVGPLFFDPFLWPSFYHFSVDFAPFWPHCWVTFWWIFVDFAVIGSPPHFSTFFMNFRTIFKEFSVDFLMDFRCIFTTSI